MEKTYIVTAQTWAGDHFDQDTRRITADSRTTAIAYMETLCPGHDTYYISEQVMEIDQQRKAKTFGQSEKYLLIQHDPHDFLDYWLRDEILATSHKDAREILFQKHEIAPDDLEYTILKASEYKSKY